jgi:hypothetical protein
MGKHHTSDPNVARYEIHGSTGLLICKKEIHSSTVLEDGIGLA